MSEERFASMSFHENRLLANGYLNIAGIDEAGRGPLAGPVVAAACILPKGVTFPSLNDSKQLSSIVREALYHQITETKGVAFGIGQASVAEIDDLNILNATLLAMQRAVEKLPRIPDYLLIDGNRKPSFSIPSEAIIQGDCLSISIAAASILAKVFRDRLMQELDKEWPGYGFARHKGYGTELHKEAILKLGPCPIHRKTFQPFKSALA